MLRKRTPFFQLKNQLNLYQQKRNKKQFFNFKIKTTAFKSVVRNKNEIDKLKQFYKISSQFFFLLLHSLPSSLKHIIFVTNFQICTNNEALNHKHRTSVLITSHPIINKLDLSDSSPVTVQKKSCQV